MSTPLRVAVVGTGIFATDTHLPVIQSNPDIKPVAAYNRTTSKAKTFAEKAGIPESNVFEDLEAVFESKDIDFVDALLPVQFNIDAVKLAVKHNKPICFEKPIAANLKQAKEIVQLVKETEVPILILENWTYLSAINTIKNDILPKIGKVVSFTYNATGPYNDASKYLKTSWRLNPEHIGGYISDGGVHQLALLTEVLGKVESISAHTTQLRPTSGDDDVLFSTLKLESGVFGTFSYGSTFGATDKSTSFTIYGTNGSIVYDWSPSFNKPTITYQTGETVSKASGKTVIEIDEVNTIEAEFKNFVQAVRSNDKSVILSTPEKGFHHLAIVAAAIESSKNNGTSVKVETP
jgi:predicted dehydrogenase